MNGLIEFESKTVRFVGTPENPEWVAVDICDVLGIKNASDKLKHFTTKEKGIATIYTPQGGEQEVLTVKEPGLYRMICESRKAQAVRFQDFVFGEVLPSLRKHQCYPPPELSVQNQAIVRFDAEVFGRAIGEQLREVLTPISNDVQDVKQEVSNLKTSVGRIEHEVSKFQKRYELKPETKTLHCNVVYRRFDSRCPCCNSETIVNSAGMRLTNGQFDHYRSPSDRSKSATWLICATCNSKLRDADFHRSKLDKFHVYQSMREQLESIVAPRLPGILDD